VRDVKNDVHRMREIAYHRMCPGNEKQKLNPILSYQAQSCQLVGLWLLELRAEETAVGYCGQNILCVMCVLQLTDRIHQ